MGGVGGERNDEWVRFSELCRGSGWNRQNRARAIHAQNRERRNGKQRLICKTRHHGGKRQSGERHVDDRNVEVVFSRAIKGRTKSLTFVKASTQTMTASSKRENPLVGMTEHEQEAAVWGIQSKDCFAIDAPTAPNCQNGNRAGSRRPNRDCESHQRPKGGEGRRKESKPR